MKPPSWSLYLSAGIFIVVAGLLVYVVIRCSPATIDDGQEPPQIYGSNLHIEFCLDSSSASWLPSSSFWSPAAPSEGSSDEAMPEDALKVRHRRPPVVVEIHHSGSPGIITANELHIPVSSRDVARPRPTHVTPQSADVYPRQLLGSPTGG